MKIAIIGAGKVGSALAEAWSKAGHEITLGLRDPNKPEIKKLIANLVNTTATTPLTAADGADVIVIAVPATALIEAAKSIGDAKNKLIIDCSNTIFVQLDGYDNGSTLIADITKSKRVVKCFNTCSSVLIGNATFGKSKADTYMCGDDEEAKKIVNGLAIDAGFERAVDCGGVENAKLLEQLAGVVIGLFTKAGFSTNFSFKMLNK